ncbi:DNA/RNA non-specific endonuclease [Variovorax sp. LT1P1]|uniref:DNA/RNA non-specific endonuclease n=1 Tax=Variovorax sp. LT1P1 TaxID=3443730 RepID=UPI003F47E42F
MRLTRTLALLLSAILSVSANAGLLEGLAERAAKKFAESADRTASEHRGSGLLLPGRDAPLAPQAEGFLGCPQVFPRASIVDVAKVDRRWGAVALCSNQFAVIHSSLSKTPLLVVERLNSAMLRDAVGEPRSDEFYPDPRLARGARAELRDYVGSGLDRGHLFAAANAVDQASMIQSFALSNMIPQDPTSNRKGAWFKVESDTRKYVRRAQGDVFIFSGPLFFGPVRTIGSNKVWVPSHMFKLVYDETTGRVWAHVIANTADAELGAPISYDEFQAQTGWQLLAASQHVASRASSNKTMSTSLRTASAP